MTTTLKDLLENAIVQRMGYVILALLIAFLLGRLVKKLLLKYVANQSTRYQAGKFSSFLIYMLLALVIMMIFNYRLSSFTLALGLAGAGIAFALQEVIVSVAGFAAILSGKFYKVGDRVQMGGIRGDVVDIGILRTTLMEIGDWVDGDLYNGKMVRVANSFLFKEPVSNYSGDFPFLWDEIKIPVKTDSEHGFFKEQLQLILEEEVGEFGRASQNSWDKLTEQLYVEKAQISPMVTMAFDENWTTYTLRYVVDFKKRRTTKDKIYTRILEKIKSSNGHVVIAGSSMEVTITNQ